MGIKKGDLVSLYYPDRYTLAYGRAEAFEGSHVFVRLQCGHFLWTNEVEKAGDPEGIPLEIDIPGYERNAEYRLPEEGESILMANGDVITCDRQLSSPRVVVVPIEEESECKS